MANVRLLAVSGMLAVSSALGLLACGSSASDSDSPQAAAGTGGQTSTGGAGGGSGGASEAGGTAGSGGSVAADAAAEASENGGSGGDTGGSSGSAGAYAGGAGGGEEDGGTVGPQCPGIIQGGAACADDGLTCPNPCMAPCQCEAGVWTCTGDCACPDSHPDTADPCMSANAVCMYADAGEPPYRCICEAFQNYGTRWKCGQTQGEVVTCPPDPATWSCVDLGISKCLTANGECTCGAEGVFVCSP